MKPTQTEPLVSELSMLMRAIDTSKYKDYKAQNAHNEAQQQVLNASISGDTMFTMQADIICEVTRLTGITRDEMSSQSRRREIIIARHGAMWLIKNKTKLTLRQIGKLFGDRDHSTVIHAIECVEDSPPFDQSFWWVADVCKF